MREPPWREEGFEGLGLADLATQNGVFYDKHRALHDCHATPHLLGRPLPVSGRTALAHLLKRARRPSFCLWAEGAPFEQKDTLKGRGYRWSAGEDGQPRAWWIDLGEDALENKVAYLREHVFGHDLEPLQRRVSAYDRYSERV